jgi:hypothetical protein
MEGTTSRVKAVLMVMPVTSTMPMLLRASARCAA